ncbi:hypothetical protein [Streptomyces sp. 5-10]|uniref:hypothetical protein n=1 Tax=Streptomyces sp. 5-10 TaxID=878925 RepID=UPI001CC30676|nr:hypothetical protein [Streptomyces sp. 5-10]
MADDDAIGNGWSEQALFQVIASLMPGARAALRRITDLGGGASLDEVQQYFADHPTTPITKAKIGGTLTSIPAVQRPHRPGQLGPAAPARRAGPGLSHRTDTGGRAPASLRDRRCPPRPAAR